MSSSTELHPEILENKSSIMVEDSESGDEIITYRRRKRKCDEGSGEIAAKNVSSMAPSSVAERLRVRSDKKPRYMVYDTDNEDDPFVIQRKKPKAEMPSEKAKSEKLRAKSEKKPSYENENSDDEDEPFVCRKREPKKGTVGKSEKLRAKSEKKPSYDTESSDDEDEPFVYRKREPKMKETVGKKLVRNCVVEKLRDRSKNRPVYKLDYSDDEDEVPIAQRSRRLIQEKEMQDDPNLKPNSLDKEARIANDSDDDGAEAPSKNLKQRRNVDDSSEKSDKSIQDNQNLARSSTVEKLRDRSKKQPVYRVDDSDDSDDMPIAQSMRLKRENKMKENNLKTNNLKKGVHISDEDELPIKHLKGRHKADHPSEMPEKTIEANLSSMSCYSGRYGARSSKRPLYNEDELDDEDACIEPNGRGQKSKDIPEKIIRDDMKKDACQVCGESDDLIGCETCTYAFHKACLLPPQKASLSNSWSCSECINPLGEIEKIIDSEMRPIPSFKIEAAKEGQKQNSARHYLVKWRGLSYLHCSWIAEDDFVMAFNAHPMLKTKLSRFKAKRESDDTLDDEFIAIRPEWTTIDRVIARRKTSNGSEYFVKWKELGYDECTWELESDISAFRPQIEKFHVIHSRGRKVFRSEGKSHNQGKENYKDFHRYDQTPNFLSGTLHPYQLEGLNFLRYSWAKRTHVILADEMGLGKTIQSIAFIASLYEEKRTPHLVVAPLSTLRNWEREFATWAPHMNVIMYCGSASARAIARQYEFYYLKDEAKTKRKKNASKKADRSKYTRIKFDVLLTSYEMINLDSTSMKNIPWECLIVDEGHRLKNKDSKLFLQLKHFSTKQRVLLTGTPLQNNMDELFMLMHFLDDGKFSSIENFQEEFSDISQEEQIDRLHKMLAPHLLRRVKKDVMKDLPPKKELILRVELSKIQKEYYKAILTRNYEILVRRGGAQISLINVVMELRKLCCHAYMIEGVEPSVAPSDANEGLRQLLESSGKMQLLDKIMVKLKEEGHRVLIYSQFQHMLDLLEDYLTYKNWIYERIDGRINGAERQIRIDRFNADNSTRFCFLLSTRAGGLGINLATADTVIIYDSDWNPHADLQAMARAHRLGQTNKVMIYRLVTRGTIEERMMQLTKKKMILEHLVVGRLKAQKTVNQEELDDIIRYGSKELFADENDEAGKARQIHYDAAAIERLLNRDQIVEEESNDDEDDDLLKAFKVANFEYIDEVEAAAAAKELARKQSMTEQAASSSANANYWEDLLKDKYEVHQVEALNNLGKGKRSRKQLNNDPKQEASSEDEDHSYENYASESETSSSESSSGNRVKRKKNRVNVEDIPLMEGEGKSLKILGFNQYQRTVFLHIMMRFGWGDCDWKEFIPRLNGKTYEEVQEYGFLFLKHLDEGMNDSPTFSDGVPKEGIRVDDILARHAQIRLIKEKLKFLNDNSGAPLFPDDIKENYPNLIGKIWKEEHDILLLKAILKHGYAKWHAIVDDKEHGLVDVVCQELNLPNLNGPRNDISSSNHLNNGYSDSVTNSSPYHHKEIERRVSEFIRKRYQLLEKLVDLELCLEEDEKANPCDHEFEDTNAEQMNQGVSVSIATDTKSLLRELPVLEPIAPAPVDLPFDNREERMNMARLYNKMCNVVETSAPDVTESYLENSRSSSNLSKNMCQLQPLYEDVLSALGRVSESNNNDIVNQANLKANSEPDVNANGLKPDTLVSNKKEESFNNVDGINHQ